MSRAPEPILRAVGEALTEAGRTGVIERAREIGGGCIHNGNRVDTPDASYFLKWNPDPHADSMFESEENGLQALREAEAGSNAGAIVPTTLGRGTTGSGSWLLMDYVEPTPPPVGSGPHLGRALAAIHGYRPGTHGWPEDNWIGSLPQGNAPADTWGDFWRDQRIVPQLEWAREHGRARDPVFDRLVDVIPTALEDAESGSLLHGDLWSGNAFHAPDGRPVLIDPAVYRGDGEVDIAMAELFGGFDTGVFDAYNAARGISEEYLSHRRALYQLYYLLVHVNLFGPSYEPGSRAAAERVIGAVRGGG